MRVVQNKDFLLLSPYTDTFSKFYKYFQTIQHGLDIYNSQKNCSLFIACNKLVLCKILQHDYYRLNFKTCIIHVIYDGYYLEAFFNKGLPFGIDKYVSLCLTKKTLRLFWGRGQSKKYLSYLVQILKINTKYTLSANVYEWMGKDLSEYEH